jgi:hypothetical protein
MKRDGEHQLVYLSVCVDVNLLGEIINAAIFAL